MDVEFIYDVDLDEFCIRHRCEVPNCGSFSKFGEVVRSCQDKFALLGCGILEESNYIDILVGWYPTILAYLTYFCKLHVLCNHGNPIIS